MLPTRNNLHLETLRGLACFLLVAFHTSTSMKLTDTVYFTIAEAFDLLRMPLFTFLSGAVYALRPMRAGDQPSFVAKKYKRLGLPLLFVGIPYVVMVELIQPGSSVQGSIVAGLHSIIVPHSHFWFLSSILIVFLIICLAETLGWLATFRRAAVFLTVASVLYVTWPYLDLVNWFGINGVFFMLPYFTLGLMLVRFGGREDQSVELLPLVAAVGCISALLALLLAGYSPISPLTPHGLAMSCLLCFALYRSKIENRLLAIIGAYSFSIYIFHFYFVVFARRLLGSAHFVDPTLLYTVGLVCGIGGPIIIDALVSRVPLLSSLLLGRSARRSSRKHAVVQANA